METRRWTNPHQPQTLQVAVFLLYASAVLQLLLGGIYSSLGARVGAPALVQIAAVVAMAAGGFGIANEKKWGYNLAVAVTGLGVLELLLILADEGIGLIADPRYWLLALFPAVRFALLVHPMSRQHQRIWFT